LRIGRSGILLGIASACLVVALALVDTRSASPGPITAVHAISAGIDEEHCARCHGASAGDLAQACSACHTAIADDVRERRGFHGGLADASRCGRCQSEHHGAEFQLAGAGTFAPAGVADVAAYAHEGLDFRLGGDHVAGLACRACHEHADAPVLGKGARRFAGESQECASCHADPHAGRLPDCRSCHGETEPFDRAAEFRHPQTFALSGANARAACTDCHPPGSAFAFDAGAAPVGTRAARDCAACHDSPHAARFVEAVAARMAVAAGASCASCHPAEGGPFREPRAVTDEEHALAGFPLDPPHASASCADCHPRLVTRSPHAAAFADYRAAHPGRKPDDCAACHADLHVGQFASGPDRTTDCHDARGGAPR
jgi:hypothetical protein